MKFLVWGRQGLFQTSFKVVSLDRQCNVTRNEKLFDLNLGAMVLSFKKKLKYKKEKKILGAV